MKYNQANKQKNRVILDYEIDASVQKVWRAISIAEFREIWLPNAELCDPEAISFIPEQEVRYRMLDSDPPFLESVATIQITPSQTGGTNLRIIHELADARQDQKMIANDNRSPVMQAA